MRIAFYVLMFILGAVMGSFLACQAWRLRYKTEKKKSLGKWSVCLSCKKRLEWFDNIPIFSWIFLRGKCRYCKKKIGCAEILAEILMGAAFLGIATTINFNATWYEWVINGLVVLLTIVLGFLAIYDGKWGELPGFMIWIGLVLAAGVFTVRLFVSNFDLLVFWNGIGGMGVLGILYLVLYFVSGGKWVGDGDWLLGIMIGVVVGNPWLSLFVLFIANFLGTLVMLPMTKGKRGVKIYFGPFLACAFVIVYTFAEFLNGLLY